MENILTFQNECGAQTNYNATIIIEQNDNLSAILLKMLL